MRLIRWIRSSRDDLKSFPEDSTAELGHGLYLVQTGERPKDETSMRGDLSSVSELASDSEDGNTYRAVYTAKLGSFLYVLHCFE